MIYQALKLVALELNEYLNSQTTAADDLVILGNIALIDSKTDGGGNSPNNLENKIILTLINIEEEKTLKNLPVAKVNPIQQNADYKNQPTILNLYVLFSATSSNYDNALIYLARIVSFFQGKRVFTNKNTPIPGTTPQIENMEEFRLLLDLYSPNFEESNYLWGTLGGKQLPFVLYKVRMIELERTHKFETRKLVKKVEIEEKTIL